MIHIALNRIRVGGGQALATYLAVDEATGIFEFHHAPWITDPDEEDKVWADLGEKLAVRAKHHLAETTQVYRDVKGGVVVGSIRTLDDKLTLAYGDDTVTLDVTKALMTRKALGDYLQAEQVDAEVVDLTPVKETMVLGKDGARYTLFYDRLSISENLTAKEADLILKDKKARHELARRLLDRLIEEFGAENEALADGLTEAWSDRDV